MIQVLFTSSPTIAQIPEQKNNICSVCDADKKYIS